jgi:hypothetical protein
MALLHSAWYQQSLRRYHARGVRSQDLQVGDLVLRLRVLKPGTYKLANIQGEVYSNAWNIQQLCRFYP